MAPLIRFEQVVKTYGSGEAQVAALAGVTFEIQSGEFAKQWIDENKSGRHNFLAMRHAAQTDQLETVGKSLRDMMPFLKKKKEVGVPVA